MVEAVTRLPADLALNLSPVTVAEPIRQHEQQVVGVLAEELGLLRLLPGELLEGQVALHHGDFLGNDFRRRMLKFTCFCAFSIFCKILGPLFKVLIFAKKTRA
jgi:hypothetical protein